VLGQPDLQRDAVGRFHDPELGRRMVRRAAEPVRNILLDYYRTTGKVEYLERGIAALRAQFPISPSENWAHAGYGGESGGEQLSLGNRAAAWPGSKSRAIFSATRSWTWRRAAASAVNGLDVDQCSVAEGQIRLHLTTPSPGKADRWSCSAGRSPHGGTRSTSTAPRWTPGEVKSSRRASPCRRPRAHRTPKRPLYSGPHNQEGEFHECAKISCCKSAGQFGLAKG